MLGRWESIESEVKTTKFLFFWVCSCFERLFVPRWVATGRYPPAYVDHINTTTAGKIARMLQIVTVDAWNHPKGRYICMGLMQSSLKDFSSSCFVLLCCFDAGNQLECRIPLGSVDQKQWLVGHREAGGLSGPLPAIERHLHWNRMMQDAQHTRKGLTRKGVSNATFQQRA